MKKRVFRTVPEELLGSADVALKYFRGLGYQVSIERADLGYPYTPTLVCKRGATTLIVEVQSHISDSRIRKWVAFAKSCTKDTRVAIYVPPWVSIDSDEDSNLRNLGAGLYKGNEPKPIQIIRPSDLTISVELPELQSRKMRQLFGSSFEKFDRSDYIDGFLEACIVLENEAKKYLKKGVKSGRVKFIASKGPKIYTMSEINRKTMGQLKDIFEQIRNPNSNDNTVLKALKRINPDRIEAAHKRSRTSVTRNACHNMWIIVQAIESLC